MSEPRQSQCRYMAAAYPTLDGEDTCSEHRHEERVFALARALAEVFQQPSPSDEQVAWFLDDADAVVDDFDGDEAWDVTDPGLPSEAGIDHHLAINGVTYVVPTSEYEPSHPIKGETWDLWLEGDSDAGATS